MPIKEAGLEGLQKFVEFCGHREAGSYDHTQQLFGWSWGLCIHCTMRAKVDKLLLTGSSGLLKTACVDLSAPGQSGIHPGAVAGIFALKVASDELVEEVFETTKSIPSACALLRS